MTLDTFFFISVFLNVFECITLGFIFFAICVLFAKLTNEKETDKKKVKLNENEIEKRSLQNVDNINTYNIPNNLV